MKPHAASSRQLSILAIELQEDLEQTGLFTRIDTKKTGLADCALVISCSLTDISTSEKAVVQALTSALDNPAMVHGEEQDRYEITTPTGKVQIQFSMLIESARATGLIEVVGFD